MIKCYLISKFSSNKNVLWMLNQIFSYCYSNLLINILSKITNYAFIILQTFLLKHNLEYKNKCNFNLLKKSREIKKMFKIFKILKSYWIKIFLSIVRTVKLVIFKRFTKQCIIKNSRSKTNPRSPWFHSNYLFLENHES